MSYFNDYDITLDQVARCQGPPADGVCGGINECGPATGQTPTPAATPAAPRKMVTWINMFGSPAPAATPAVCPKCGCQTRSPFSVGSEGVLIHNVDACMGSAATPAAPKLVRCEHAVSGACKRKSCAGHKPHTPVKICQGAMCIYSPTGRARCGEDNA